MSATHCTRSIENLEPGDQPCHPDETEEYRTHEQLPPEAAEQSRRDLEKANDLLRAIIEAAPTPIFGLDRDGKVQYVWNPAAEKLLGWSAEEAIGNFLPSVAPEKEEEFRQFRERIRSGLTLEGVEVQRRKKDGTPIAYSIYGAAIHDSEGQIAGNVAVLVDITERRRMEERVRHLNQVLRAIRNVNQLITREKDRDRLIQGVCDILVETRGYQNAWIALAGNGREQATATAGTSGQPSTLPEGLTSGETISARAGGSPPAEHANQMEMAVPLQHGEAVYGLLGVSFQVAPDEEERALLDETAGDIALALHDIEAEKKHRQAEYLLSAQRDLGLALSAALDSTEIYRRCVETTISISGMDCGGLYLVNEADGSLDLVFHSGLPPLVVEGFSHYDADSPNARLVMTGEPLYRRHEELSLPTDEVKRHASLRAIAIVPIRHQDRVIACLNIASHTLDHVPAPSRATIETIAAQLGNAIARAREEEVRRRRVTQLALLNDVGRQVVAMLRLDQALEETARLVQESFGYHHVGLFTFAPNGENLVMSAKAGSLAHVFPPGYHLKAGQGMVGWVACQGQTLLANDVHTEPCYVNQYPDLIPTASELSVPIRIGGQTVGVLDVQSPHRNAFDENDVLTIETLADQLAVAIKNAQLYESVQRELAERTQTERALRQSEERFRRMFQHSAAGMVLVAPSFRLTQVNNAFCQMLDYAESDLLTKTFQDITHPDDRAIGGDLARQVLAGEREGFQLEKRYLRADGTVVWGLVSTTLIRDAQGHPLHFMAQIQDITGQKQAEEEIRWRAETLAALHETALDLGTQRELPHLLQAIVARATSLLKAKGGGIYLYRRSTDDLEFAHTYNLSPDFAGTVLRRGEGLSGRVLAHGSPLTVANYSQWEGRAEPYEHAGFEAIVAVPIFWGDRLLGVLNVQDDAPRVFSPADVILLDRFTPLAAAALENSRLFHDLQRQMDQLTRTQAQLVQSAKLAAVGALAAGVAHEINNPLTSILGFAELAAWDMAPDTPGREELDIIIEEATRTRDIVRNLLDFARQTKPVTEQADVNQVLRQTLTLVRAMMEKDNVRIKEEYASDLGLIPLDVGQMKQVFLNLMTNAAHAMPTGGTLTLSTARVDNHVAVRVSDTGIGILPQDREHIFDPFFTTKPSGTGLGLSVSLGIVQQHGGRIDVDSVVKQGSTFTVWLPTGR